MAPLKKFGHRTVNATIRMNTVHVKNWKCNFTSRYGIITGPSIPAVESISKQCHVAIDGNSMRMAVERSSAIVTYEKYQTVQQKRVVKLRTHHAVLTVHKKNCEPLVLGPALAIDRIPRRDKGNNIHSPVGLNRTQEELRPISIGPSVSHGQNT